MKMPPRPHNLPLIAGLAIVGLMLVLALFGPALALRDPLSRTLIAEIGGQTRGTPFPPFQSWEWPLGSDRFGRDLYSRLLYAVRPTLLLVLIVALVRLGLGVLIGTIAGWSRRAGGRALNLLLDAALALPLLIVALAAITVVGIETGLLAFIVGMCLTGWAETGQVVRAQTQLVAGQPYIAAARALGATGPQIVLRHISRHIGPLLATLFAFELSAALMLTAALAFLGYFIGGGVWVITAGELIPIAERVTGMPELGQLVGTAEIRISSRPPWEMIFPGLLIALAILGFTLLGEGLRRRQMRARPAERRSWPGRLFSAAADRVEEVLLIRAGGWDNRAARRLYALTGAVLLGAAGWTWGQNPPTPGPASGGAAQTTLADQPGWPVQRGDPYGTLRGAPAMPTAPSVAWEFRAEGGLSAPAVGADGSIYVVDATGALHALAPDGQSRWQAAVEGEPVGTPAVGADGMVYVVDRLGGLNAYGSDGTRRWRFVTAYRAEGSSGPVVGSDGAIYYAIVDAVQAVNPAGAELWLGRDPELPYLEILPRLSPDGQLVFLKNSAFNAADGSRAPITVVPDEPRFADGAFLVGANGRTYYRSEHRLVPWRQVEAGVAVQPPLTWSAANAFFMPADAGVSTGGTAWMLYSTDFADTRLVWIGSDGAQRGEAFYPLREARVVAANDDDSLLVCGQSRTSRLLCAAFSPAAGAEPLWTLELGAVGNQIVGGAVSDGRTYIVGADGVLYALE